MYSNIPFVIQRNVLVCEQSNNWHDSLRTYITVCSSVDRCFLLRMRTPKAVFNVRLTVYTKPFSAAMSNPTGLQRQKLCHYLNQGRRL